VASLVLFVLIGAGHVLPAFHFALVAHRVCAEHGELVHDVGRSSLRGRECEGPAFVAAERGHEHEHCGVAAGTGAGVALAASAPSGSAPLPSVGLARGAERCAFVVIALHAYAPKLAPPATGT
jgi:hypothetical protein